MMRTVVQGAPVALEHVVAVQQRLGRQVLAGEAGVVHGQLLSDEVLLEAGPEVGVDLLQLVLLRLVREAVVDQAEDFGLRWKKEGDICRCCMIHLCILRYDQNQRILHIQFQRILFFI